MRKRIGVVTIGQAPRSDVVPGMQAVWGSGVEVLEAGALDGLAQRELAAVAPGPGDYTLISRLRDGTPVRMGKAKVLPLVQQCIQDLEAQDVAFTLLLCTGEFPAFPHTRPLLEPDRLLLHLVQALLPSGRLGVLIPLPEQVEWARSKWQSTGLEVALAAGSPYHGGDLTPPARELGAAGCGLIIMDCMGFSSAQKAQVESVVSVPVIQANSAVARMASELL